MNIVLVGKTGGGKTEVCKYLTEYLRYDKIISYTTRKKRINEVDGLDYNFITEKDYNNEDFVLKTNIYGNNYGIKKSDIVNSDFKVLIVDKNGLEELKKIDDFNFVSFFIECDSHKRYLRCIKRGDSPMYVLARMEKENELFKDLKVDYLVENETDDPWDCVIKILELVKESIRG